MREVGNFALLMFFVLLTSCASFKQNLLNEEGVESAIKNAILDFSSTNRNFNKNSVFQITVEDSFYTFDLTDSEDGQEAWVLGQFYEDIIGVSILTTNTPYSLKEQPHVGEYYELLSLNYLEQDEKLFLWNDLDKRVLSKELLEVLQKYNLLVYAEEDFEKLFLPVESVGKSVHYYFCRENPTAYRKVHTNTAMGYYTPPSLVCDR